MGSCKTKKSLTSQIYWCQLQIYDKKKIGAIKYLNKERLMLNEPPEKLQGSLIVTLHQMITSWEKRTLIPEDNIAQGFEYITGLPSSPTFL